ncbi:hypothetical protein L7F22_020343 [Adiantum nelumboides]|nr:hypothetical protein [Adiantum nelumboides]
MDRHGRNAVAKAIIRHRFAVGAVTGVEEVHVGVSEDELWRIRSYGGFHCVSQNLVCNGVKPGDGCVGVEVCATIAGLGVDPEEAGGQLGEEGIGDTDAHEGDVVEERGDGVGEERGEKGGGGELGGAEGEGGSGGRVHGGQAEGESAGMDDIATAKLRGEGEGTSSEAENASGVGAKEALASAAAAEGDGGQRSAGQRESVGDERAGGGSLVHVGDGVAAQGAVGPGCSVLAQQSAKRMAATHDTQSGGVDSRRKYGLVYLRVAERAGLTLHPAEIRACVHRQVKEAALAAYHGLRVVAAAFQMIARYQRQHYWRPPSL